MNWKIRALWRDGSAFICGSEPTKQDAYEYAHRVMADPRDNLVCLEILTPGSESILLRVGKQ